MGLGRGLVPAPVPGGVPSVWHDRSSGLARVRFESWFWRVPWATLSNVSATGRLGAAVALAFKWENTSVGRHKVAMAARPRSGEASGPLA